jgi:hypothetical protein
MNHNKMKIMTIIKINYKKWNWKIKIINSLIVRAHKIQMKIIVILIKINYNKYYFNNACKIFKLNNYNNYKD